MSNRVVGLARQVEDIVDYVSEAPVDLRVLPSEAVPGSIFSGAAGIALFLLRAADYLRDERLVDRAHSWIRLGTNWARRASDGDWQGYPYGYLLGAAGTAQVDALICARQGEMRRLGDAVRRIAAAFDRLSAVAGEIELGRELYGGIAGIVCATRTLASALGEQSLEPIQVLSRVEVQAVSALLSAHRATLCLGGSRRLGMGHGVAGELWSLVVAAGAENTTIRQRLSEFDSLREIDEEGYVFWPPSAGSWDGHLLSMWCNGVPGSAFLWCEVARQSNDERALQLAKASTETMLLLGGASGGLCCGLASQSLVLYRYAELAKRSDLRRRSYELLRRAIAYVRQDPEARFTFWTGALGVGFAAMDRLSGRIGFPCLEVPR